MYRWSLAALLSLIFLAPLQAGELDPPSTTIVLPASQWYTWPTSNFLTGEYVNFPLNTPEVTIGFFSQVTTSNADPARFRIFYYNSLSGIEDFTFYIATSPNQVEFFFGDTGSYTHSIPFGTDHSPGDVIYLSMTLNKTSFLLKAYDLQAGSLSFAGSTSSSTIQNAPDISALTSWQKMKFSSGISDPTYYAFVSTNPVTTHSQISNGNDLVWHAIGDGTHTAVTKRVRVYRRRPDEVYAHTANIDDLTGPLSCAYLDTETAQTESAWAYDVAAGHPATSSTPGDWTWLIKTTGADYGFYYDATTKIWQPVGFPEAAGPSSMKEAVPWTYDPVLVRWTQSSQIETWTYDPATKKWTGSHNTFVNNSYTNKVWSYDYASSQWTNETTGEVWRHHNESNWSLADNSADRFGISLNNGLSMVHAADGVWYSPWRAGRVLGSPDDNLYSNNNATEHYNWYAPVSGRPFGTMDPWNTGLAEWRSTSGTAWTPSSGGGTKYFPRDFPPLVVLQHQDIISAYDTAEAQEILNATPAPTATWTANGRSNEFGLEIEYDTGEGTAPLKITTTSPNTQLLSDLLYNPVFTALGDWQFTDSTNGHTWTFEDETGIWTNNTTGHQIQYSSPHALCWHDTTSSTSWEYNENTQTWTQGVEERSS